MRLATLRTSSGPHAAVRLGEHYLDLPATDSSFSASVRQLLESGTAALERVRQLAERGQGVLVPAATAALHAPIPNPAKIICLGLNYRDHAIEANQAIPEEPVLFSKFASALIGHGESVVLPRVSSKVDYEAELVVVIGKKGRHIPKNQGMDYVAGYCVGHDVSARDWQFKGETKQWLAGKTFDTFAPVGPELVMTDEVADPHRLGIRLRVNDQTLQDSNTNQLIFSVPEVIAYASQIITLEPGDLIFTGTPPGVGAARKPPVWLKPGDIVEVEIDSLGTLRNPCVAEK